MKKILIALDYDPFAATVAETGYKLSKALDAEVLLLHVIREPAYYSSTEYSPIMGFSGFSGVETLEMIEDLRKEAKRFLEESKKHLGDERIQVLALEGDFADTITQVAKDFKAELIVMGTHHRKGLDKFLLGNLAEKILNTTSVPLLAIPEPPHQKK